MEHELSGTAYPNTSAHPEYKEPQQYLGTKLIEARPMTRAEYNKYRGWELPANEDGADEGFLVEYLDGGKANDFRHRGYISWSPADVFHRSYRLVNVGTTTFSTALQVVKAGGKAARKGWNGKGMFIYYVGADNYAAKTKVAKDYFGPYALVPYRDYIAMKTVDENVVPWVASQTDLLAEDWQIIP